MVAIRSLKVNHIPHKITTVTIHTFKAQFGLPESMVAIRGLEAKAVSHQTTLTIRNFKAKVIQRTVTITICRVGVNPILHKATITVHGLKVKLTLSKPLEFSRLIMRIFRVTKFISHRMASDRQGCIRCKLLLA